MNAKQRDLLRPSEDDEQIAVIEYCEMMHIDAVHIPNEGKRSVSYAVRMKRMGLRSGFPDLLFPYPRMGYHGLYIEMKAQGGKLTADQKKWLAKLNARGYCARVCVGADEAINTINWYMNGE